MNGKKKLLIVNNNIETGGIQKALINLLHELDKKKKYDIDLFLFSNTGEYKSGIPASVNVIEGNKLVKVLGVSQKDSRKIGLPYYLLRGLAAVYARKVNRILPIKLIVSTQKKLKYYDVAISFMHNPEKHSIYGGCNEFVIDRVCAGRKIAFVHCDFLNYGGNNELNRSLYGRFDGVAAVSEGCRKNFIEANPELNHKTFTVKNCQNYEEIRRKGSEHPRTYDQSYLNVITVSRLSSEKGIVRTINVIERLVKGNEKIIWHIIGSGSLEPEVKAIIKTKSLENRIIAYGKQENPYQFMTNADLLILPSYHEAAPMVFDEAKCLGIPILTTDTSSAAEMVTKYGAGWVCENTAEGIYNSLKDILNNRHELDKIKEHLKELHFGNKVSIGQFEDLVDMGECYDKTEYHNSCI